MSKRLSSTLDPARREELREASACFAGYPCNLAYDFSGAFPLLEHRLNNVGDPEAPSLYRVHSKDDELFVLQFFRSLWHFSDDTWGYVTHSGTEGNMQGLYVARECFPDGVLYCSQESHYSIRKVAHILRIPVEAVRARENGEMDYDDLDARLARPDLAARPAIVCLNLGTTMKGAVDDAREVHRILVKRGKEGNYYMHADGALMGFVLPFLETDTFFKKRIHSISTSGHKFPGVPFPCGIFMMERRFLDRIGGAVEYIGCADNTVSGSRNGHSAAFLRYIIEARGLEGFRADVLACLETAEYLIERLREAAGVRAWRNKDSITVVFPSPPEAVVRKWQLATQAGLSHVVVMPHVTRKLVDALVAHLSEASALARPEPPPSSEP